MGPVPVAALVALQAPPSVPDPGSFSGYDDLGIAAILIFVIFLILGNVALMLWAFYKRIIVWGSTCDKLVENAEARADAERAGKEEAQRESVRMGLDFSQHLERVLNYMERALELARRGASS